METAVLAPGEGKSIWVVGDRYTVKTSGKDTGGVFALMEAEVLPGGGPPPHIHRREDEAFYVLEGRIDFHADGRAFTAGPGAWITLAKGSLHGFRNPGPDPAKMLIMVTPAGLEEFFLEVGRESDGPVAPTPEDVEKLMEAAPRYGIEIRVPHQAE
jgi:quercetin dioxygenase-like cupin family protein